MTLLTKGTWVVVADGAKALILQNTAETVAPYLALAAHSELAVPPSRELGTDMPGRVQGTGPGGPVSAIEPTDLHRQAEAAFARDLAEDLGRRVASGQIGQMVLVAPPRTLGDLRAALSAAVAARVVATVAKDLTKHPLHEIARILQGDLA